MSRPVGLTKNNSDKNRELYLKAVKIQKAYKELVASTDFILEQGFGHPDCDYRYAACLAFTQRKKFTLNHLENLLSSLLDVENTEIQQVARYSLIITAKKVFNKHEDFGPLPGASEVQTNRSHYMWCELYSTKYQLKVNKYEKE